VAQEHQVPAVDGRTLRVVSDGDPDGIPVLVQHGTPSEGSLYEPHVADARERGIRLLGYDRPGYGGSSPHVGRNVADCARDVEAIADTLELERLAVWGVSGGGPHALACGALLGGRVVAVAALSSVGPADAADLDWTAGMGEENVVEFEAALRGREALAPLSEALRAEMLEAGSDQLREAMHTLLTPVDAKALTGEFAEFMYASISNGLRDGIEGWLEDDLAFVTSWGFDVESVDVPVLLWHGEHDRFVPIAHGRWLAERLPDVDARLSDVDGHLTIATRRVPEVHAWLVERFQA
jgi:pimeloyl-ACP methyl ester carboxylesterase